jgi:hypothetical protein
MSNSVQIIVDEAEGVLFGPFETYEIAHAFLDKVYEDSNINISDFNIYEVASVEDWVGMYPASFKNPDKLIAESK